MLAICHFLQLMDMLMISVDLISSDGRRLLHFVIQLDIPLIWSLLIGLHGLCEKISLMKGDFNQRSARV